MKFPVDQPYAITTQFSAAHPGIDIAPLPAGTTSRQAVAPESGKVVNSSVGAVEGNFVIMRGNSGVYYYFGHFSSRNVTTGQMVNEGQSLGIIGQTGQATGVHTHHEVRPNGPGPGSSIDPEAYYNSHEGGQPVSASNDVVDETAVRQAYNAGLLRDPTQAEIDARVQGGNTLQQMQSSILASDEHKAIIAKVEGSFKPEVLKKGDYRVE